MTPTTILFDNDARRELAAGADILARAVVSTLGPRSRNVAINRKFPGPVVLHDGVSVAGSIRLKNPFQDMGAVLLREAASKTNAGAGDGTTTATLLGNTLIQEGFKLMSGVSEDGFVAGNIDPMSLKDELAEYSKKIVSILNTLSVDASEREVYERVASISSASPEMGKLVAEAMEKIGSEGIFMVEKTESFDSSVEYKEGMQFDNGFLSGYFINNISRESAEYKDAYVLITNQRIVDAQLLVPLINKVVADGAKPLVIIADDVTGPALAALVKTKLNGVLRNVAVMAPEYGERRKEMLQDIAILTGGIMIDGDLGMKLEDTKISDLGRLKSVEVNMFNTTISPENPDHDDIKERVEQIRNQISMEQNAWKKQRLEERLGRMTSGVAVINVGGASMSEIEEREQRVIDAVHATKDAVAEGIVAGSGMTLWAVAEYLQFNADEDEEKKPSFILIQKMLRAPINQLLINSGFKVDAMLPKIEHANKGQGADAPAILFGLDVVTGKIVDLIQEGIIDPVKVQRLAVIHAIGVASTILTTNTLVSEEEDTSIQKMQLVNQ